MAEIELRDVVKRFGTVTAVDRINLTAEDKEFIALVGPSGCGKTTEQPSSYRRGLFSFWFSWHHARQ